MINDFDLLTTCDISGFIKEEIRSILIYKSDFKDSDIVLDINCGVGEISSEFSNLAQKIYAIDESQQAITISQNNIKKHGNIDNVELINENELSAIEKTNGQTEISIESSLNLKSLEKAAKNKLGMQKLDKDQKVYVTIPKKDYTESATPEVKTEENTNWFTDLFSKLFK